MVIPTMKQFLAIVTAIISNQDIVSGTIHMSKGIPTEHFIEEKIQHALPLKYFGSMEVPRDYIHPN